MDLTTISLLRNPGAPLRRPAGTVRLRQQPPPDPDGGEVDKLTPDPTDTVLALLAELDAWLAPFGDRPPAGEFAGWRRTRLDATPAVDEAAFDATRSRLGSAVVDAVPDWAAVRRLTRSVLLLELLDPCATTDADLVAAGTDTGLVFDLLRRRTPLFPDGVTVEVPQPKVELVRTAKVSDLFVVRSEWKRYQRGEIAAITNVLRGEEFERTSTLTEEQETTVSTEVERTETTERSDEDLTRTEVSREVDRAQELQVHVEAGVNVSGNYGMTSFAANTQLGVNASLSENARQASRLSRDVVSKALSRVESRVREERVQRTLRRSVDRTKKKLKGDPNEHVRGVYRWVDRIDRYQVFRYPDRLQLEFQIPEPAEYLRHRLGRRPAAPGGVDRPPAFDVLATNIDESTYAALALKFRAANVPPPPDFEISVSAAASLAPAQPVDEDKADDNRFVAPQLQKELSVVIPKQYMATGLTVAATALPVRGNWRVEWNDAEPVQGRTIVEGFHHILMTVAAGGERLVHQKGSVSQNYTRFAVQISPQLGSESRTSTYFGDAYLATPANGSTSISFKQPVLDNVNLAVSLAGASSAAVSAEVACTLRLEARAEWQNSVYDVLLDAWRAWDREWRLQEETAIGPALSAYDASSPARNLQVVTEELKRQVVGWLLDEDFFVGRDAMASFPNQPWTRYSISAARQTAPVIQFLEQGLEWGNLTYVAYPYYWARGGQWDGLAAIEGADPVFVNFLRSGSARVVVPVRPGFELAVLHWLIYQEPFLGDPMPLPDDDLYVSIATEIRDLTRAPDDGEPGDSWEARLPTTLMWLEDEPELPTNAPG